MSPHEPQFAWFLWSLLLLGIWALIYLSFKDRESKREMLIVSLWTSLLGLTEPLFVPEYWNPPSVFDLAHRTGFDLESIIFSFAIGGIAVVLYGLIFKVRHTPVSAAERSGPRHQYHLWAIVSAPAVFLILIFATPLNPIYSASIALIAGGLATWYCRPDLKKKMLMGAFLFLVLYFFYFLTLVASYPGYVERVWNLPAVSGILFAGIPIEELMFALGVGFLWAGIYEHLAWRKISRFPRT